MEGSQKIEFETDRLASPKTDQIRTNQKGPSCPLGHLLEPLPRPYANEDLDIQIK